MKNKDSLAAIEQIVTDPGVGTINDGELFKGWSIDELKDSNDVYYNGPFDEEHPKTYVGNEYTLDTVPMTIEDLRVYLEALDIHEGDVLNVYAVIYNYYSVTYYGLDAGVSLGSDIVLRLKDQTSSPYTVNMAFTAEANAKFMGWNAINGTFENIDPVGTADTIYQNKQEITITGNIVFKVYAPIGNWLVYDTNGKGGTYNAPEFYIGDTPTKQAENAKPENMKRYGYTFGGWYMDAACTDGNEYMFNEVLEGNRTIYAKWTENPTAPYTVLIWRQKIGPDGKAMTGENAYELYASHPSEGTIGANIPYRFNDDEDQDYVDLFDKDNNIVSDYQYKGFSVQSNIDAVPITIDGKATLNIYYDRILYNVRFYVYRTPRENQNNGYSYGNNSNAGENTWGIVTWHNSQDEHPVLTNTGIEKYGQLKQSEQIAAGNRNYRGYYFTVSAKYGEYIGDQWPTYDDIRGVGNNVPVSFVMMNGTKLKPRPSNQGDGTVKGIVSYLDDNILGATNQSDGNFLIVRFNQYNSWKYHIMLEVLPDANGNYPAGAVQAENTTITGNRYYLESVADLVETRSSNTIADRQNAPKLNGYDTVMKTESVAYSDRYNNEVDDSGYNNTPELSYYYNLQTGHISFMDGQYVDGDDNQVKNQSGNEIDHSGEIPQGSDLSNYNKGQDKYYVPDLPEGEEGYVFEGWYFDKACTKEYTFDTMPIGGIIVYAKWRQIEYRVFLHPEAGNSESNPNLYWGSDDQEMAFRIAYGDKVSTPTGIWTDGLYEFVAWFTDDGQVFDGDLVELNEKTVTEDYDKSLEENYTDDMDQWGNGATYNKDERNGRWWITKKLDLTAQWREVTPGAKGIDVYYNAVGFDVTHPDTVVNGTVNGLAKYQDPLKYLDSAGATSTAAAVPSDSDYQFLFWVVQKWNEESEEYEDVYENGERVEVFPGDDFTVYKKYSKAVVTEWKDKDGNTSPTESDVYNIISKATYSMYLRAEYGPTEMPADTHITWYANGGDNTNAPGTTNDIVNEPKTLTNINLQINEAVSIPVAGTFIRNGYKFIGWAKDTEPDGAFDGTTDTVDESKYSEQPNVTLWLQLNEDGQTYTELNSEGTPIEGMTEIQYIAADELNPYQAVYAVWQGEFYVYHSGVDGGNIETIAMSKENLTEKDGKLTFNLTEKKEIKDSTDEEAEAKVVYSGLTPDTLYGGYYLADGFTAPDLEDEGETGEDEADKTPAYKAYDGDNWTWTTPQTDSGMAIEPKAGETYYIKEVPAEKFLQPYTHYTYYKSNNVISDMWMISDIDDLKYVETGFVITKDDKATVVQTLTVQNAVGGASVKLTPQKVFKAIGATSNDYLSYLSVTGSKAEDPIKDGGKVRMYWVTPDGLRVTGTTERQLKDIGYKTKIQKLDEAVPSTITEAKAE